MPEQTWVRVDDAHCPYWTLPPLMNQAVFAAFTTRHGGVSSQAFTSFNLSGRVGDVASNVTENRRRWWHVASSYGFEHIQTLKQVHGSLSVALSAPMGRHESRDWWEGEAADALFTRRQGVLLGMYFADCVPVIVVSPSPTWVGIIHAGWRGLVSHVIERTIRHLSAESRWPPEAFQAFLGPSIEVAHYEVNARVLGELRAEIPDWSKYTYPARPGRIRVDVAAVAVSQLRQAGIPRSAITRFPQGTYMGPDFFSHRQEGKTGRCMAFVGIRGD